MSDWKNKKVLVTGGRGFLGHHVVETLKNREAPQLFIARSSEFDLTREENVERLFKTFQPDIVFHLAGLVGGILANKERPAEFFYQNLMMGTLMLHHAQKNGVKKFIAAGAGCGYPENAPIPLKEESFWEGLPQPDSAPYSLAKRLLTIQAQAYEKQYGFTTIICVPGNIYGPWDNFHLRDSHVVPALVRKFVEASAKKEPSLEVWGSGKPTRDFVYAGDVALGMIRAAEKLERPEMVNLSSGKETSILEVCEHLKKITGYSGNLEWNSERPEGQARRLFDVSKAERLLDFTCPTGIGAGLAKTVAWYKEHQNSAELRK